VDTCRKPNIDAVFPMGCRMLYLEYSARSQTGQIIATRTGSSLLLKPRF